MLKPFFPYYGSKWRIAKLYPKPDHDLVIEPFCGSAGYSTYWEPKSVLLCDADPVIVCVWNYLINTTSEEVLDLPDLAPGELVNNLDIPQAAKWLIGFWINRGSAVPKNSMTAYSRRTEKAQLVWGQRARERIAAQLPAIKHWQVKLLSYEKLENRVATWFADPPYQVKGRYYRFNKIDYEHLGQWVSTLTGQIIACEHPDSTWLPFVPLVNAKTSKGFASEAVYLRSTSEQRAYHASP